MGTDITQVRESIIEQNTPRAVRSKAKVWMERPARGAFNPRAVRSKAKVWTERPARGAFYNPDEHEPRCIQPV